MLVVGTESSQWCHNNSVLQLQVAQLEGFEEVRRHGGDGWKEIYVEWKCRTAKFREKAADFPEIRLKMEKRANLSATAGMRKINMLPWRGHLMFVL
jgi:rubredoxin